MPFVAYWIDLVILVRLQTKLHFIQDTSYSRNTSYTHDIVPKLVYLELMSLLNIDGT